MIGKERLSIKKLRWKKHINIHVKNIINFVKSRNSKTYFSGTTETNLNIILSYIRCESKRYRIWNYKTGMSELQTWFYVYPKPGFVEKVKASSTCSIFLLVDHILYRYSNLKFLFYFTVFSWKPLKVNI